MIITTAVQFDYSTLRGRIREKCGTEGRFSTAIGCSHTHVSQVFNGRSFFTPVEIDTARDVLEINSNEIGDYFFTRKLNKTVKKRK